MKQSLPSLIAAAICGLAGAVAGAVGDGLSPAGGGVPMPIEAARSPLTGPAPAAGLPASTAPSLLGGERSDLPARPRPNYLPSNLTTGAGNSPIFGPQGVVPASHAEESPFAPASLPPPPPASTVIADSIRSLSARRSISAKTRQGAKLFGRELVGSGTFAQGPSTSRLVRYDLQLMLKDRPVSRLQVSDGQYLWIVNDLKGEADIERIEVDRLVSTAAAETAATGAPQRDLALGGVSRLMASLEKSFDFTRISRSQLGNVPVFVIEGSWKPPMLARALPDQFVKVSQGQGAYDTSALRGHIPDRVCLWIGADDLFPYRVEYRRLGGKSADANAEGTSAANGSSTPSGSSTRPAGATTSPADGAAPGYEILAYIDFFEVRFDVLLDGTLFTFAPGTRPYIDVTDSYLAKQKK